MFIFFFLSFNFFFLFNTEDKQSQMLRNVFPFLRICVDPSPLAVPQGLKPILPNSCALLYSETGTHSITYKSRPAFPIFLLHFSKRIHLPHTNSVSALQLGASMGAAQLAVPLLSLARMTKAAFHGFLFFFSWELWWSLPLLCMELPVLRCLIYPGPSALISIASHLASPAKLELFMRRKIVCINYKNSSKSKSRCRR